MQLISSLLLATVAERTALLVIDVQNDFMPSGSLPVAGGDEVVSRINALREALHFDLTVFTQDWHPNNHISFASSHDGKDIHDSVPLKYSNADYPSAEQLFGNKAAAAKFVGGGRICDRQEYGEIRSASTAQCSSKMTTELDQILWPKHCVQATQGAAFHPQLNVGGSNVQIVRKGWHPHIDSYSAMYNAVSGQDTALPEMLAANEIDHVYVVGLALDYCVQSTAMDILQKMQNAPAVTVLVDATRSVDPEGTGNTALTTLKAAGATLADSSTLRNSPETAAAILTAPRTRSRRLRSSTSN